MLTDEMIASMKEQAAKNIGGSFKTWAEFHAEMVDEDGEDCGLQIGNIPCDGEAFERIFKKPPVPTDVFSIESMPVTFVVPFAGYDASMEVIVLATHNLKQLGHVEFEQAEANIYRKINEDEPAYILTIQAEDGLAMHKV